MIPKTKAAEHQQRLMHKHRVNSFRGARLRNATGDIDTSSLGYQIAIDTLTFIVKEITEQKFYMIAPADYIPLAVGNGAFSQALLTNLVVNTSGPFESGNINQGSANDRLATANAAVASKTVQVVNWAKAIGYSIFEIEQALQANNWDYIESLHVARKTNWDLGIQQIAFLGSLSNNTNVPGLLTQASVNSDTTTLTAAISSLSAADFATFVKNVIESYQSNCNFTAYPTHFIIPQSDWNGLATPVSSTYPVNSKLEYLKNAFKEIVPGGVTILPLVYSQSAQNSAYGVNLNRYVMYRKDPRSLRMDIPVDLTITSPNTVNNFQFQDAGYGQYTGVGVYRNLETLYFDFA